MIQSEMILHGTSHIVVVTDLGVIVWVILNKQLDCFLQYVIHDWLEWYIAPTPTISLPKNRAHVIILLS